MDKIHHLNKNQSEDFAPLGKEPPGGTRTIRINDTEIVKINDELISHPCDRVKLDESSFHKSSHNNTDADPRRPEPNDRVAKLHTLHPPIIINLRNDAKPEHKDTREILSESEINYLHKNNYPAILFIHGFNVPYGEYSQQIIGINSRQGKSVDSQSSLDRSDFSFEFSQSSSTIMKSQKILENEFNNSLPFGFRLRDEELNGSGAHNWFTHMEYNINQAAGKISDKNYSKYARIINIAWSGDVLPIRYLDAEEIADAAGKRLVNLIKQLESERIKIYIIAHSLGGRVALNTMETLAENSDENVLQQVFLWQPAVPNYSLSNSERFDHSIKYNSHFPNAHLSTKKITVLYSKNDWILRYYYFIITRIGITPKDLFTSEDQCQLIYRFMDKDPIELLAFTKLIEGDIHSLSNAKQTEKEFDLILRILKECYRMSQATQAMGYQGVDLKDPFMRKLITNKKLILVNQNFLNDHCAMKIPDNEMMELAYKRWIINKQHGIDF